MYNGTDALEDELCYLINFLRQLPKLQNLALWLDDKSLSSVRSRFHYVLASFPVSTHSFKAIKTLSMYARSASLIHYCPSLTHLAIQDKDEYDLHAIALHTHHLPLIPKAKLPFCGMATYASNITHLEAFTEWTPVLLSSLAKEYPRLQHLTMLGIERSGDNGPPEALIKAIRLIGSLFNDLRSLEIQGDAALGLDNPPVGRSKNKYIWTGPTAQRLQERKRERRRKAERTIATLIFRSITSLRDLWLIGLMYEMVIKRMDVDSVAQKAIEDEEEGAAEYDGGTSTMEREDWFLDDVEEERPVKLWKEEGTSMGVRWKLERFVERKDELLEPELKRYK